MLKLDQITKKFHIGTPDETTLFNQFCFEVQKGEFVSIVGSNGSGKTTLLNIVCGSLPVEGGKVFFGGKDITRLSEYKRADQIGRVFQDPKKGTCDELTILENMAIADHKGKRYGFARGINKKQISYYRELLSSLRLGLEEKLETKVGALSGGQRQAMALLMATMTPVDLLILDEHTAALDPKTAERIMELTDEIVKKKQLTAIMVTHNLRYAVEYGNRLLMMHQGEIIMDRSGKEKQQTSVEEILKLFNEISIECGN